MNTSVFIVPHDFTNVGDVALKYALFLAKPERAKIILLHVLENSEAENNAMTKLNDIISNLDLKIGDSEIEPRTVVGNIFDDIPKFSEEVKATLIIMGTHGALGMQKLFGSYAMKVITNSNTPFLIVQDGIMNYRLENIVVPITYSKESLQIINVAIKIALTFDAKIHILFENYSDQGLQQRIKIRQNLIDKQFNDHNVEHSFTVVQDKSFSKGIIDYAKSNEYDMIAIAHYTDSLIPQLDRFTQGLITNKEDIPCLVINSKLLTSLYF